MLNYKALITRALFASQGTCNVIKFVYYRFVILYCVYFHVDVTADILTTKWSRYTAFNVISTKENRNRKSNRFIKNIHNLLPPCFLIAEKHRIN